MTAIFIASHPASRCGRTGVSLSVKIAPSFAGDILNKIWHDTFSVSHTRSALSIRLILRENSADLALEKRAITVFDTSGDSLRRKHHA
jgi:hypothetical protein